MTKCTWIPLIETGEEVSLPAQGSWPAAVHVFDEDSALAVRAALAAQRPLLVRGEPGVGKSQLARAAAAKLGWVFLSEVVHSRSESQDLQWRFDAIGRLGDAQALGGAGLGLEAARAELAQIHYVNPGPLWWAFNWKTARIKHEKSRKQYCVPDLPPGQEVPAGCVLLIDEIDKAEAELPNGLLETLGNGAFAVPWMNEAVRCTGRAPLVVITTNQERELPPAFERRCLVLNLQLPGYDELVRRGKLHFGTLCGEEVFNEAARQLLEDRADPRREGLPKPGQAEYLDMLRVVSELWPGDHDAQFKNLERIGKFALRKHPLPDSHG